MSEIVWEDPPPRRGGGGARTGKWARFARELMERPGEWARLPVVYRAHVHPMTPGGSHGGALRRAGVDPHAFERRSSGNDDGTVSFWARYIGSHGEYADEAE